MPSPEYLEAGKFKIQRSNDAAFKFAGTDLTDNLNQAKLYYK